MNWLADPLLQVSGNLLWHSFVAGLPCVFLALVLKRAIRRTSPGLRYGAALSLLCLVAIGPIAWSFLVVSAEHTPVREVPRVGGAEVPAPAHAEMPPALVPAVTADVPMVPAVATASPAPAIPLLALLPPLWGIGALATGCLVCLGVVGARRLRRSSHGLDPALGILVEQCLQGVPGADRVQVLLSSCVNCPVLVGLIRPIVLLPVTAVGWSPDLLRFVLLHELAHARRWDNWVNLGQRVVESVLFYQPAVWLVSSWVREERECCCDDFVIRHTQRTKDYARALIHLAEEGSQLSSPVGRVTCPAASHALIKRVSRLLGKEEPMQLSVKSFAVFAVLTTALLWFSCTAVARPETDTGTETETEIRATPDVIAAPAAAAGTTPERAQDAANPSAADKATNPLSEVLVTDHVLVKLLDQVRLSFVAPGQISRLEVSLGQPVKRGEVLVRLEASRLKAELIQLEAGRETAASDLLYAKKAFDIARLEVTRAAEANKRNRSTYSPSELRRLELETQKCEVEIVRAKAAQETAMLALELKRTELAGSELRAGFDGAVTAIKHRAGEYVSAGDTVIELTSLKRLAGSARVSPRDGQRVRRGMVVEFRPTDKKLKPIRGVVTIVGPEVSQIDQSLEVGFTLENPNGTIRPGTMGRLAFLTSETSPAGTPDAVGNTSAGLTVHIDAKNVIRVDDNVIEEPSQLTELIRRRVAAGSPKRLSLLAHPDSLHKTAIEVLDAAMKAGVEDFEQRLIEKPDRR